MADISKITLPSGNTYDIKDTTARADIAQLKLDTTSAMHFIGATSTVLSDGATTNPIKINNVDYTPKAGDVVTYTPTGGRELEFVWSGAAESWQEYGSTGSLKALAFKDSASGKTTPSGSVSQPTFSGTKASGLTVAPASSGTATYTPEGTVSQPTFSGTSATISSNYTPAGSVTVKAGSSSEYTPAGSLSQPGFTGTEATIPVSGGTGTATYTPAGTVGTPTISVKTAGATTTVNSITDVGSLPTLTTTVANENLTIGFSQGTLPTKGANTTVKTGDAAYQSSQPSFTGTGTRLTATYTPAGSVSTPTFTGTKVTLSGSFSGTAGTATATYTPAGGVSQPTFTGTGKRLVLQDYTPAGTVTKPTFTGTEATVTVS